jgi:predicted RNase H-like HicB family nuclease/DNA-binding XRE family transcriptional regulator
VKYRAQLAQEGRHWLVSFADCPGCQTFGDSREDALEQAREALEGWLEAHLVNGQVPPRPKARRGDPIPVGPRLGAVLQIRWEREARGLSQAALAELAGVKQQQIAKLEDPDGNPTLATLEKLADALGLRLEVSLVA